MTVDGATGARPPLEIVGHWRGLPARLRGAVVAMGAFDGVHRGHQAVIANAAAAAKSLGAPLAVLTFSPLPKAYFRPGKPQERLMDAAQFEAALGDLGVERMHLLPMKALSHLTGRTFAEDVLSAGLGVRHVAVGFDNTFGADRRGSDALAAYSADLGFGVSVTDEVKDAAGAKICSTAVREHLRRGALREATIALGRPFAVRAQANEARIDRRFGLTRMDIALGDYVTPRCGRYAAHIRHDTGASCDAVGQVMDRPGEGAVLRVWTEAALATAGVIEVELLAFLASETGCGGPNAAHLQAEAHLAGALA